MTVGLMILLALVSPPVVSQVTLDAVPGGVVEIPLTPLDQPRPTTTFGQERVLVMEFGKSWVGLVGLPLDLVPGQYIVQARTEGEDKPIVREFTVFPRRTRRPAVVTLDESPPAPAGVKPIWRDSLDAGLPLSPPVDLPAEPLFGRYRQVSETRSEQVDFVVFRVTADTRVTAPGNGRVAAVTLEETGSFVWIDHGMGLFTRIGPLSATTRKINEPVEAGRSIGKFILENADEPRDLYWSVFLNGAVVDPFLVSSVRRTDDGS